MYKYIISGLILACVLFLVLRDKEPVFASAETIIQAPIDRVWKLQTDISEWKSWNRDIESMQVTGDVGPGTVFIWKAGGVTIESKITEFIPEKRIAWQGTTFGVRAYHVWEFYKGESGVKVYTTEKFTGPIAWLLPGTMRNQISKALQRGVTALKQEAEKENGKS